MLAKKSIVLTIVCLLSTLIILPPSQAETISVPNEDFAGVPYDTDTNSLPLDFSSTLPSFESSNTDNIGYNMTDASSGSFGGGLGLLGVGAADVLGGSLLSLDSQGVFSNGSMQASQLYEQGALASSALEAADRARKKLEEDRRKAELAKKRRGGLGADFPDVPPAGPAAENAIAWAQQHLGKPYNNTNPARFGPDAFDCSGLIYMAYKNAGIAIPTVSGPQYAALPHVPLEDMQRGDLIFWGTAGKDHVAMYLGGGRIIQSGRGGVKEMAVWGSPVGAARVVDN